MVAMANRPTYFCRIRPNFLRGCRYQPAIRSVQLKRAQVKRLRRALSETLASRESRTLEMSVNGTAWQIEMKYGDRQHAVTWWSPAPNKPK